MVPYNTDRTIRVFFLFAIILFLSGMIWGLTGALQYLIPGWLKETLSFERVRPLHVSSEVFWIVLAAVLSVFAFLHMHTGKPLKGGRLLHIGLLLFSITIICILVTYSLGIFGGREYWEFHPVFALPILCCWIIFLITFLRSAGSLRGQPVYIWMWMTGFVFFLFTYLESNLWLLPYFRNNIVNDMTIQWKSYGAMVGSWNMLIYGSSIFLLDKISGSKQYSYSGTGFALYFLGLFNLMFNWGHHIYTLPTYDWVRHISYGVSMTELLLLFRIIFLWRKSLHTGRKYFYRLPYKFLVAADIWILLTLVLALGMSIPAINIYTHGTHITVAHTMGATIGINSFLLLAFAFTILKETCRPIRVPLHFNKVFWSTQIFLFLFWIGLIGAGIVRSVWQMAPPGKAFGTMISASWPWLIIFFASGVLLFAGCTTLLFPLLKNQWQCMLEGLRRSRSIPDERFSPGWTAS